MRIQGRVLEFRKDGKGIKLDTTGEMYSVFAAPALNGINIGDMVEFDFKEGSSVNKVTGKPYLNITGKVSVLGSSSPVPISTPTSYGSYNPTPKMEKVGEPVLSNSRCIIRQNALTNSIKFWEVVSGGQPCAVTPGQVLAIAKEFEAYTSGDADLEEVNKELGEQSEE